MFNLRKTLNMATEGFLKESIDFALIGGFALGAHGIHRATKDIDLLEMVPVGAMRRKFL